MYSVFIVRGNLMKVRILQVATAFFLVGGALLCTRAVAQREGLAPNDPLDPNRLEYVAPAPGTNVPDDRLSIDHETKVVLKDSAYIRNRMSSSAHNRNEAGKASPVKDDDDAMSFNFLYYIIQKFKISDLVDE